MSPASDPKQRFTSRVSDYVLGRPTYPRSVIDVLNAKISFAPDWRVADIGAGTGISTRLFLDAGNDVVAVEPNEAMRSAAEVEFAGSGKLQIVGGSAEATGLQPASIDLIVAAQAFHWFDRAAFFAEARRILTPRGCVLLMWNTRTTGNAAFGEGFEQIVEEFSVEKRYDRHGLSTENLSPWFDPNSFAFIQLPNDQVQDFHSVAARLASSSYMPHRGHPKFEPMMAALRSLFDANAANGTVVLPHVTELYLGRPLEQK